MISFLLFIHSLIYLIMLQNYEPFDDENVTHCVQHLNVNQNSKLIR